MRWPGYAAIVLLVVGGIFAGPTAADILNVLILLSIARILYAVVAGIVHGDQPALILLAGSVLYIAGTATEILSTLVPMQVSDFAIHGQLYGAIAQVLILGFALGQQTKRIHSESIAVQTRFRDALEMEVTARTRELAELKQRFEAEAITDGLTGLYNRRELDRRTAEFDPLLDRSAVGGGDYMITVVYIDIDDFKRYNDRFGYDVGDAILRSVSDTIRRTTRGYDLAFRIGGDEFVILMPETDVNEARKIVERLRTRIPSSVDSPEPVSVSIGVAGSEAGVAATIAEVMKRADHALLDANQTGKNRVTSA